MWINQLQFVNLVSNIHSQHFIPEVYANVQHEIYHSRYPRVHLGSFFLFLYSLSVSVVLSVFLSFVPTVGLGNEYDINVIR